MKATLTLLSLPFVAALAMAPASRVPAGQDPQPAVADPNVHDATLMLSELQFTDLQGKTTVVPARSVQEIRLLEDGGDRVRIELTYQNGDWSLVDTQAMHLLRNGPTAHEVKLVRCSRTGMKFPRLQ